MQTSTSTHIVAASLNGVLPPSSSSSSHANNPTANNTTSNNNNSNGGGGGAKRHRESYTVRDKINMVKRFQSEDPPMSVRKFSTIHGIPSNTFKHWIQLYESGVPEELVSLESQNRRRIRPGKYPNLEKKVVEYLKAQTPNDPKVAYGQLRDMCEVWSKEYLSDAERVDFALTHGWILRVLRRHSLMNVEGAEFYNTANEGSVGNLATSSGSNGPAMPLHHVVDPSMDVDNLLGKRDRTAAFDQNNMDYSSDSGIHPTQLSPSTSHHHLLANNNSNNSNNNNNVATSSEEHPNPEDVDHAMKVIINYARAHRLFDVLDTTYQLSIQIRDHGNNNNNGNVQVAGGVVVGELTAATHDNNASMHRMMLEESNVNNNIHQS